MMALAPQNSSQSQNIRIRDQPEVGATTSGLLWLDVTVLRAHNLPRLESLPGKERRYYVTVTHGARAWRTQSVRSVDQRVEWNENLDAIAVQPLSRITVSLYAKRMMRADILVGRQEIACESRHELSVAFSSGDGKSRHSTELATLLLTITALTNASSSLTTAVNNAEEAMDALKSWKAAVDAIKWVMDTVGPIAELLPHAKLAWSLLSKIPETLLHQFQRDDNIRTLLKAIRDGFEFAKQADVLRLLEPASTQAKFLDEMLECVSECAKFIRLYAEDVQVGKRTLKNMVGRLDETIEQYRTTLARLRQEFLAHATVATEVAVLEIGLDARIGNLSCKGTWQFGDEKRCLPGTREDFLDYIVKWVENDESPRALLLLGQAGTGKSSIAYEIAHRFQNRCLGSFFAFVRNESSKDEAHQLFTTLAHDLSDRYPPFKLALGKMLRGNPSLRRTRHYRTLFESLLLEPLKSLQFDDPILVVIDALDESGDATGRNGLHSFLAQRLFDLPSNLRILITSRPENGIEPAFNSALSVHTLYMDDPQLAAKTEQDICLYLQSELPPEVFDQHGVKLAKAAEGLFQWAAVSCGLINNPPPSFGFSKRQVVHRLLGHSRDRDGQDPLDQLYEEVLEGYFKPPAARTLFRSVMGQIFAAIEPLSISSLVSLRQYSPKDDPEDPDPDDSDCVVEMLRHLGSLLSNVTSSHNIGPIVPLHTSFRDFLASERSGIFHVDLGKAHRRLIHSCLGLMLDNLKFNICKLESSYVANRDVPDIESRISTYIPPALSYACIFWDHHLEYVAFEDDLFTKLRALLEKRFLFLLEVLSIKNSVGLASPAMASLKTWLGSGQQTMSQLGVENLLALVNDALAFVRYFGMAIARSAPHIYISALPFAPSSSRIVQHYLHKFPHTLSLKRGQLSDWPALEMTIQAHGAPAWFVAFSPDGRRIASASFDRTIRVWDATTGEAVASPFTGHTHIVCCAVFSPDGQRIASASDDRTVLVWDSVTGEIVAGPFTGHAGAVRSVAFSPDGQHIASASYDRTIRVWDARRGEVIAAPFSGHIAPLTSVAFSPDGRRIASGSIDRTIRVWDAATGEVRAGPFTGHTDDVYSVAFSPDGQRIASGSGDRTIRVWNAATGEVEGLFIGHTSPVLSVAFSPDEQRITSASIDRTIRMWDFATGEVVAGPFTGHTDSVTCVAVSPDGQRIASASADCTICVWDARQGEGTAPFTGHTQSIFSVALSPDGQRIVSASADCTICLWDVATGEITAGPFTGHTDWVADAVFSPDGQRIASASRDRTIRVWDAVTGDVVAGPFHGHTDQIMSLAFSSDGQHIASCSKDFSIRVWDAATGEVVVGPCIGHTNDVFSVAFSPDGERIASASVDRTICIWGATTGELVMGPFVGHTEAVHRIAFSPDGQRIASASADCTIFIWDSATGEVVVGPFTGHTDVVSGVAFSPDGQRLSSASYDRTILVWDSATGTVIAGPFTGHSNWLSCVAFSPDGRHIVSASADCTIRMWDATTGRAVVGSSTRHLEQIDSAAPPPDGQRITSPLRDRAIPVEELGAEDIKIDFTDKFPIYSDGWMYGEEGEHLLWIPQIHRPYVHRHSTVWIAGKHYTELDFSNFVHGSNWVTVYGDSLSE